MALCGLSLYLVGILPLRYRIHWLIKCSALSRRWVRTPDMDYAERDPKANARRVGVHRSPSQTHLIPASSSSASPALVCVPAALPLSHN
jgi:hypothetical protein